MITESSRHWHVIYTKSRHEKKVAASLAALDIEHFLPTSKNRVQAGRKKKWLNQPLFPSYVFARPLSAQGYLSSLQIPGVLHYVKTGKTIAQVPEDIIERLRTCSTQPDASYHISTEHFLPGTHHQIHSGPFSGFICEVVEHRGKAKILVRLELLQRNLLLDLPAQNLLAD